MNDIGTTQIALASVGTVTVSFLVFLMVQTLKDLAPGLHGRAAMVALYVVSLVVAVVIVGITSPDWYGGMTWVAVFVVMALAAQLAKGYYADLFKVSVAGSPPSPNAAATVVTDPAPDNAGTVTTVTPTEGNAP